LWGPLCRGDQHGDYWLDSHAIAHQRRCRHGYCVFGLLCLGITLITTIQKDNKIDLNHFLFGNILGVTAGDVRDTAIIAALVLIAVFLLYKELLFYSFDPLGAQAAAYLQACSTPG
jgi:hypothetical protein